MINDSNNVNKKTKQSLLWFTILPFVLHVIRFSNAIILARILTPEDFGIMGFITVLFYYCNSITDFGLTKAIIQRQNIRQAHYNSMFCFNLLISFILFAIANLYAEQVSVFFAEPAIENGIHVYSFIFILTAFIAGPKANLKRRLQFKSLAKIETVQVFSAMLCSLTLALNGFGYWSLIIAMVLSQVIATALLLFLSAICPKINFSIKSFKELAHFGLWDFLWGQSKLLGDNIDKLIIGKLLGTFSLGIFEKANGFARMPNEQLSARLSMVAFSTFSRVQNDKNELTNYLSKTMTLNAFLCFPIFIGLAVIASDFTLVLLGDKWGKMIPILPILAISYLIASTTNPITSYNSATGKIKQQTCILFIGVLGLIIGLLTFAEQGILAAAIIIFSYNCLLFILSFILLQTTLPISIFKFFSFLWPSIISCLLMLFAIKAVQSQMFEHSRGASLLLTILVGITVYSICFLVIPFKHWTFLRRRVKKQFTTKLIFIENYCQRIIIDLVIYIQKYWILFTSILLIAITVLSLLPNNFLNELPVNDKFKHFIAYFFVALPVAIKHHKLSVIIYISIIAYSGIIELIQPYFNRNNELLDWLVNSLGILLGFILGKTLNAWHKKQKRTPDFT